MRETFASNSAFTVPSGFVQKALSSLITCLALTRRGNSLPSIAKRALNASRCMVSSFARRNFTQSFVKPDLCKSGVSATLRSVASCMLASAGRDNSTSSLARPNRSVAGKGIPMSRRVVTVKSVGFGFAVKAFPRVRHTHSQRRRPTALSKPPEAFVACASAPRHAGVGTFK